MTTRGLDQAVRALLMDRHLVSRFRRSPDLAMSPYGLTALELEAVKKGDVDELIGLGLDPELVWPRPASTFPIQSWLLQNAKRLAPAALLAAVAVFSLTGCGGPSVARRGAARRSARARARSIGRQTAATRARSVAARAVRSTVARTGARVARNMRSSALARAHVT